MKLSKEQLDELTTGYKTPQEMESLYSQMLQHMINRSLDAEMQAHLGYERHETATAGAGENRRNGKGRKTVQSAVGVLEIETPRDREGTFEPQLVKKRQVRLAGMEEKILALYAKGMTTRDIESSLVDLYGVTISHALIAQVTDAVLDEARAWQTRPLDAIYPIVRLDGIVIKVQHNKQVVNKSAHVVLGVNLRGEKEVLGLWSAEHEGAKFWLSVLTETSWNEAMDFIYFQTNRFRAIAMRFGRVRLRPGARLHKHGGARKKCRLASVGYLLLCLLIQACVLPAMAQQPVAGANSQPSADLHIALTDQERAYLAALPVLRVGMDPNWPPYAFVNARGEPDGISADYLRYIVQTLHLKVQRVDSASWGDTVRLANSGKVELLVAMSQADQSSVQFLPTQSYIDYPEVIVTRQDAHPIVDIHGLDGLRVAMIWDSGAGTAPGLTTSIAFHRMMVNSAAEGLQAVADGKAQAFVGNFGVIDRLIHQHYAGVLRISGATGYSQSLVFGVAPGYEPLLVLMNRVLEAIPEEDRERIHNTWLSSSLTFGVPRRKLWEVLTPISLVILVFIAVLSFIIAYLRKEVLQRRKAEQELQFQLQFLQSLMTTAPIPVFVKDLQGRYLRVNAAFEQLVGMTADALLGKTARDVHPQRTADDDQLEVLTRQAIASGDLVKGELQYRTRAGETHDVMYWLRQVYQGKRPRALLGLLVDVSTLRAMEREQRLHAESLARAIQKAEEAAHVKDVFLATMSHEIRTPMSGVIGVLDLMSHARLHDEDRHLLDMARGAAGTLLRILNDVLDFSKSQSGKLTIESKPFSLRTVIDEVTGLFEPEIRHRGLRFDAFVSELVAPALVGDGQRLAQVLFNLVGNALKFTDQGGIGVVVETRPVDPATQMQSLLITVRDTGVGIDEAEQARLFEPFVQAGTRHQGGTGLGLAICKRLIQAMGGSISLRSAVGEGTSVDISLALPVDAHAALEEVNDGTHTEADVAEADIAPLALTIPGKSILLVEDQAINRELLVRQCQALGIQSPDVAVDGLDAWHAYEKHAYTLVITDCAMPRMDGQALIRRIRAGEKDERGRAYLVALTANAMESQRQACLDAGANEAWVKPVNLDQLRMVLANAFGSAPATAPPASAPSWLPESIPAEDWPELRERIVADMGGEFKVAREALDGHNWKRAYDAVHRILGVAKWFGLSDIATQAVMIQAMLDEGRTEDVVLEPLEKAIASLAADAQGRRS